MNLYEMVSWYSKPLVNCRSRLSMDVELTSLVEQRFDVDGCGAYEFRRVA